MELCETGKIHFVFSFTVHPGGESTVGPSFLSIKRTGNDFKWMSSDHSLVSLMKEHITHSGLQFSDVMCAFC